MNIAVILAGGKGLRFGGNIPKQMLQLGSKPVISWSVDTFHKIDLIDKIIIVSEKNLTDIIKKLYPENIYPKITAYAEGGKERSDSSYNALESILFNEDDIILFHDAARPFISEDIIVKLINTASITGAAGTYVRATDTVALVNDMLIKSIPERDTVYSAQTPQCFKYDIIKKAHMINKKAPMKNVTDDISLVVNMGADVAVIIGSNMNIKITTELDMKFAEFLITAGHVC